MNDIGIIKTPEQRALEKQQQEQAAAADAQARMARFTHIIQALDIVPAPNGDVPLDVILYALVNRQQDMERALAKVIAHFVPTLGVPTDAPENAEPVTAEEAKNKGRTRRKK